MTSNSKDWMRQGAPVPVNIKLTSCSWSRDIIRRPGPGLTETIEPKPDSDVCTFTFEIEEGDLRLEKTVKLPAAAGGETLMKALAHLVALHAHAIGKEPSKLAVAAAKEGG